MVGELWSKLRATWQLKHVEQQSPLSDAKITVNKRTFIYYYSTNRRPSFINTERGNTHKSFLDWFHCFVFRLFSWLVLRNFYNFWHFEKFTKKIAIARWHKNYSHEQKVYFWKLLFDDKNQVKGKTLMCVERRV